MLDAAAFLAFNTNEAFGGVEFPVTMRAIPTIVTYNNGGTSGGCHKLGSPDITGVTNSLVNTTGFAMLNKTSGFVDGASYGCTYSADAEL